MDYSLIVLHCSHKAREVGDEIVLEGRDPQGSPMRWIFSNITEQSFRWRRVVSPDGGKTWRLHKEMLVRRADPAQQLIR
jgi:hypothetical protein